MKTFVLLTLIMLPVLTLSARGFAGGGGGRGGDGDHTHGNDYTHNMRNVNPGYYYYGPGYASSGSEDYFSQPGQTDDTDALYESYLQSNPKMPAPMGN